MKSTLTTEYYGSTRDSSGSLDIDKEFTGQRLDGTGLYYYGARYYDPTIGRFISPDTVGPNPINPQSLNRYSYCFNNPLAFIDPTGNWGISNIGKFLKDSVVKPIKDTAVDIGKAVSANIGTIQTVLDVAGMIPGIGEAMDALNGVIYLARGDELNAGLSFASCVPVAGSLATVGKLVNKGDNIVDAAKGIEKARILGKQGEDAVRATHDIGPSKKIVINGRTRVPDGLTDKTITEVKNVQSLGYTKQLRDYADYARENGLQFNLYVRETTNLSDDLVDAWLRGDISITKEL